MKVKRLLEILENQDEDNEVDLEGLYGGVEYLINEVWEDKEEGKTMIEIYER